VAGDPCPVVYKDHAVMFMPAQFGRDDQVMFTTGQELDPAPLCGTFFTSDPAGWGDLH
jgi:hypothetical protein